MSFSRWVVGAAMNKEVDRDRQDQLMKWREREKEREIVLVYQVTTFFIYKIGSE